MNFQIFKTKHLKILDARLFSEMSAFWNTWCLTYYSFSLFVCGCGITV